MNTKRMFSVIINLILATGLTSNLFAATELAPGAQPQVSIDPKGIVRVAFGRNDSIFCSTSINSTAVFSKPIFVGRITGMHLGMGRGPQIASSSLKTIITAMDKSGDIHFFQLDHRNGQWVRKGMVNDVRGSAPEGLMSIAADNKDNFYAVWLDLREERMNNIYFSALSPTKKGWTENRLVYRSPDGHVCECCKPNIAVNNTRIALMFRNWIGGSRDLYLISSINNGRTFSPAQKLGSGTWPLKGCPMDGGGIAFTKGGTIITAWTRQGAVYTCHPGQLEQKLSNGKYTGLVTPSLNHQALVSFQEGENVKIIENLHQ
jgi:hypothetical protein